MKNLVKFSWVFIAVVAFASCRKADICTPSSVNSTTQNTNNSTKSYHDGFIDDGLVGTDLTTDKDKCKKCHGGGKTMGIDWNPPFMSDNRYNSIEELIDNFDFVNEVHMNGIAPKGSNTTISESQKMELINYLQSVASEATHQK